MYPTIRAKPICGQSTTERENSGVGKTGRGLIASWPREVTTLGKCQRYFTPKYTGLHYIQVLQLSTLHEYMFGFMQNTKCKLLQESFC